MTEENRDDARAPEPEPKNEVSELIASGKRLHEDGEYARATEEFRRALERDPHSAEAHNGLGLALYWQYKYDEAVDSYNNALRATNAPRETRADTYFQRGDVLYSLRRFKESAQSFAEAQPIFDALAEKAHARFDHKEGRRLEGRSSDAHNGRGYALFALKNYEAAWLQFEKAIARGRKYPYAYHNLASLYWAQGMYAEAREQWAEAYRRYRQSAVMDEAIKGDWSSHFLDFGNLLHEIYGDLESAEEMYLTVIEMLKESVTARAGLVAVYIERAAIPARRADSYCKAKQRYEEARETLKKRVEAAQDLDSMIALGELHLAWNDYDGSERWREGEGKRAEEWLTKALEKDEADAARIEGYTRTAKPCANLGVVHARREEYKEAIEFFERALMIESDDLTLRSNLAEAYLREKQLDRAEREYLYVLGMAPEHVESLIGLGEVYLERAALDSDMFEEAAASFKKALALAELKRGSKRLKNKELAKVFYLRGYSMVKSFDDSKLLKDPNLLRRARADFRSCVKYDPEHFNAQRAVEKIDKTLGTRTAQRWLEVLAPFVVFAASAFLFGVAQWKYLYKADDNFGVAEYTAMTFGSLALIVAGAYLPQVLKLKFAGLELEKNSVDQVATLGTLGITKGV